MSYKCAKCQCHMPEGTKMVKVVTAVRPVLYVKTDRWGNIQKDLNGNIMGREGHETVKEMPLCPDCAASHNEKTAIAEGQKIVVTKPTCRPATA